MVNLKARTLQQRFGFCDADLKARNHDEILQWLDQNIESVVKKIGFKEWKTEHVESSIERATYFVGQKIKLMRERKKRIKKSIEESKKSKNFFWLPSYSNEDLIQTTEFLSKLQDWRGLGKPPARNLEITDVDWESPITTGRDNKYIVGFADMKVTYDIHSLILEPYEEIFFDHTPSMEKLEIPKWAVTPRRNILFFEVKAAVKSLGELVRQIRMYETYVGRDRFYVVCPDDSFKELLRKQRIGFVKYEIA